MDFKFTKEQENYVRGIVRDEIKKQLKEQFRVLHHQCINESDDVMKRFYRIESNKNAPVLLEKITLNRIIDKHGNNGFISISANRSDKPQEENDANTQQLIRDIKQNNFGYLPVYGGYRNTETGEEAEYEPSFIVFNFDSNGKPRNFEDLKNFAIAMCGKYNQDCVLIKAPNKNAIYVNDKGEKVNDKETSTVWKNDATKPFFTSIKDENSVNDEITAKISHAYKQYCAKQGIAPTKNGFEKFANEYNKATIGNIGRRFTYDISFNECYVNPMPATLTERMRRKGEIMIWE